MNFIGDIINTMHRYVKSQVQTPYFLVFSIAQPIFWLIIFGKVMERSFMDGSMSYIQYITPGIVVMNVLYDAGYSGMSVIEDIRYGVFNKMLASPTSRIAIVIGNLLASFFGIAIQVIIIYIIGGIVGFKFIGGIQDVLIIFVSVGLLSFGFAGCSKALAFFTKQDDPVVIIVNFITMPMIFLSSILLPVDTMPDWAKNISLVNPLEYAVRIIRQCGGGLEPDERIVVYLLILLVFAILGVVLATMGIKRTTN